MKFKIKNKAKTNLQLNRASVHDIRCLTKLVLSTTEYLKNMTLTTSNNGFNHVLYIWLTSIMSVYVN